MLTVEEAKDAMGREREVFLRGTDPMMIKRVMMRAAAGGLSECFVIGEQTRPNGMKEQFRGWVFLRELFLLQRT